MCLEHGDSGLRHPCWVVPMDHGVALLQFFKLFGSSLSTLADVALALAGDGHAHTDARLTLVWGNAAHFALPVTNSWAMIGIIGIAR